MRYYTVETTEKLASAETTEDAGILHTKKFHVETHHLWAEDESHAMRLAIRRHPAAHRARVLGGYFPYNEGRPMRKRPAA